MSLLNWKHIKEVIFDEKYLGLNLLFLFIVIYIIKTGGDHHKVKFFLLCFGLTFLILFVKKIKQPLLWYFFLIILIHDLISDYFVRANHHFFLIYLIVLTIIYLHNQHLENFVTNIKLLLVIVLFFSGIQKLLSPQFISGDFYYYMINTGKFFKPIFYFSQETNDIIASNKAQILELKRSEPNSYESIYFENVYPNLNVISRVYAWVSIIIELAGAVMILWKPKNLITHILFIMIILGVFLTRLESGFLALLAISGVWLTDSLKIRAIYVAMTILFFALIITNLGFY